MSLRKSWKFFGWRMIQVHWHGWKDLVRCRFAYQLLHGTVDGRNPALVDRYLISHDLQGFIHVDVGWLFGISSINSTSQFFFPPILTSSKSAAWQIWPPMHFSNRDDRRVAEVEDQSGLFRTWQILILGSKFLPVQIILKITSPAKSVSVIFEGGFCPQLRFLICSFSFLADQNSKMCPDFVVLSNFPSNFPYQQGDIYDPQTCVHTLDNWDGVESTDLTKSQKPFKDPVTKFPTKKIPKLRFDVWKAWNVYTPEV